MTYEFQYLMYLLSAAATGKKIKSPQQHVSWQTVFNLAQEQHLLPLLMQAVKQGKLEGCPTDLLKAHERKSFSMVLTDCARRGSVITLLEEMEELGIHAFVMKGMSAAANYSAPENRISSDTDICIELNLEEKTTEFLKEKGFSVSPRWENGHHFLARHPEIGLLEVHVRLYDELVEDVWFKRINSNDLIQEQQEKIVTDDGVYWTLGPTDHLIFMTLHLVKHFISEGISFRMMLDVALFLSKNKQRLDLKRFWSVLDLLHYTKLVQTLLGAMVTYCGFSETDFGERFAWENEDVELLLNDLEAGGWLGKKDEAARKQGGYEYNRQVMLKERSNWQYHLSMLNWQHSLKWSTLFPNRKRLQRDYPCLEKRPILLPFVWLHRILFRGFPLFLRLGRSEQTMTNEVNISKAGKERVMLFHKLDML